MSEADDTLPRSEAGGDSSARRGEKLRPSSVGVLRQSLNFYLHKERDFVDVYFPEIARRGYATWHDVFELTDRQADALRPIMSDSVEHFRRQDARERNRNVNLLTREVLDPEFVSGPARKAKYWTEAVRDLCAVYGLDSPI